MQGGGVVESIGEGVTGLAVGDHVIPLYTPECGDCLFCKSPKTNLCVKIRSTQGEGVMPDGTTRYRNMKGEPIYHFMGCSCFSQYIVTAGISLAKINPEAPLEVACLLGCGITTGASSHAQYVNSLPIHTVFAARVTKWLTSPAYRSGSRY